ncbi:MAG: tRNA dihydrouridine(20/20a) synthase DusA [Rhodospirillaceae bacterium]
MDTAISFSQTPPLDRRVSVAPMMDRTDRHDRYFLRQIAPSALLYTEMITTGAVLHGDRDRFLRFDPAEQPVAIQLGGANPAALAQSAAIAQAAGYVEVNLNVGCPSDRVQNARFGACLMNEPALVAECVRTMIEAVDIPVTVKTRIGVDDRDSWDEFRSFVDTVAGAGCKVFVIHARKAWLQGLSPKENREIPPLSYETVYRLKQTAPELHVSINGGVTSPAEVVTHLRHVDGVMIGRAAYENPWLLAEIESGILGGFAPENRMAALDRYIAYMERECARGVPLYSMARHALGLFQGLPGARAWRRHISENGHLPGAGPGIVQDAARHVERVAGRAGLTSPV